MIGAKKRPSSGEAPLPPLPTGLVRAWTSVPSPALESCQVKTLEDPWVNILELGGVGEKSMLTPQAEPVGEASSTSATVPCAKPLSSEQTRALKPLLIGRWE